MSKDTMQVTRLEILRSASLIKLFDWEAKFADLHYDCVGFDFDNSFGHHRVRVQEHLKAIVREIKRR